VAERKVYLYRLNVTLPPEAADPEWEPQAWLDQLPPYPAEGAPPEALEGRFQWPRNRLYLSLSAAKRRAALFEKYGATVTVERSPPVTWPQDGLDALCEAQADVIAHVVTDQASHLRHGCPTCLDGTGDPD
jgi:hypothetical protein